MLIDEAEITVVGGHGGPGKASFFRKGTGPDGGNGGKGGDVYFKTTTNLNGLNYFSSQKEFFAQEGAPGASNKKSGADARDLTLLVPMGTDITDLDSGEAFFLDQPGQTVLLAKGGIGGQGNDALKNARMTTPLHAQHGMPGQRRHLKLILRLLADFGLIGLPNTGKSSLLNAITSANVKVGDYQFTTLEPNLGAFSDKVIADIPGLIEGASQGKGLGTKFLKHIEKVEVLFHCISADSANPLTDYKTVRKELATYNKKLLKKKEIIVLTKTDLVDDTQLQKTVKSLEKITKDILTVSVFYDQSLEEIKKLLR